MRKLWRAPTCRAPQPAVDPVGRRGRVPLNEPQHDALRSALYTTIAGCVVGGGTWNVLRRNLVLAKKSWYSANVQAST